MLAEWARATNWDFVEKSSDSVHCVAAVNLAAHSLGGFVESFSGHYVCRFCTGKHFDFQSKDVRSGAFELRTRENHAIHVQTAQNDDKLNNVTTNVSDLQQSNPLETLPSSKACQSVVPRGHWQ